jgi:general secretion pathway protein D
MNFLFPNPRFWLLCLALACPVAKAAPDTWFVTLDDAELRDVVQEMASILGETVVLDPRVKGRITVMSEEELDRQGVRRLFYSVLDAHGFAAINEGDRLLILPAADAKARANRTATPDDAEFLTQVLALQTSSAADMAALLRPLASAHGYVGPSASANALVITDVASNTRRVAALAREIDAGAEVGHTVVELRHGLASEIAEVIEQSQAGRKSETVGQAVADARSNRLVIVGNAQVRKRLVELARSLDTPAQQLHENSRVIRLRHGDAAQLAEMLDSVGQRLVQEAGAAAPKAARSTGREIVVRADESQNAVVILADPGHLRTLAQIVEQLDQPRAQVLIQAAIVEISGDVSQALGVQWGLNRGSVQGGTAFSGTELSLGNLFGPDVKLPDGGFLGIGNDRFGLLVSALASNTHNNLLSTPSLLTLDNQEAEILVGQNVPFQTGSYTTSGSGADNPFTTVERKDVGISLKIRPHINEGATLRLEVEQENSEIAPSASGDARDLITNKRSLKSTILADDGEIIVIGGLIKDVTRTQASGVPLLKDVPWLGGLFRWSRDTQVKTNLMVFLRPTIVRGAGEIRRASQDSYDGLRQAPQPAAGQLPAALDRLFDQRPGTTAR